MVLVFAAVMGFTFLSTVTPTAGLVAKFFGVGNMATLFGVECLAGMAPVLFLPGGFGDSAAELQVFPPRWNDKLT